jgi:hypothetical protein
MKLTEQYQERMQAHLNIWRDLRWDIDWDNNDTTSLSKLYQKRFGSAIFEIVAITDDECTLIIREGDDLILFYKKYSDSIQAMRAAWDFYWEVLSCGDLE